MQRYQVTLPIFYGPLDLLLFLVKRNEINLLDISIAQITDQFLQYLAVIEFIDVDSAGEFLIVAATLLEMKSRLLLPVSIDESEEETGEDPRRELIRQLMEYRKFKDASGKIDQLVQEQEKYLTRKPLGSNQLSGESTELKSVEIWDLVAAFGRLVRQVKIAQPQTTIIDETPQVVYENLIIDKLHIEHRFPFESLFIPPFQKTKMIGLFLALLELIKRRFVHLEQQEPFGTIWIELAPSAEESSPMAHENANEIATDSPINYEDSM